MNQRIALLPRLYFSYGQFMVYDESLSLPGCAWTAEHTSQGFARRQSNVNFNTPLDFGYADVVVDRSAYQPRKEYVRVIEVPFLVTSGKVIVEGLEEREPERNVTLPPGDYRLIAAQRVTGNRKKPLTCFSNR